MPDASLVIDYNRYLYARGNALRFADPSGHYSNDEIMQHFGCENWECVEGHFQDGGSHSGMWGWLYILQQARNGDSILARGISTNVQSEMSGAFQLGANGQIQIQGGSYSYPTGTYQFSGAVPELTFAGFPGNFDYGDFTLSGPSLYAITERSQIHNGLYFDASKIDKQGLAIAALSAGSDAGPIMMAASPGAGIAAPAVFIGGLSYTIIGATTDLVTDVIIPINEAIRNNNASPALEVIMVEGATLGATYAGGKVGSKVAPFVGPTYDVGSALAPGFCWGTGCR